MAGRSKRVSGIVICNVYLEGDQLSQVRKQAGDVITNNVNENDNGNGKDGIRNKNKTKGENDPAELKKELLRFIKIALYILQKTCLKQGCGRGAAYKFLSCSQP